LPPGSTQTGSYTFNEYGATAEFSTISTPLSFPIPLAAELGATQVHMVGKEEWNHEGAGQVVPAACTVDGTEGSPTEPLAQPGHLCVFSAFVTGVRPSVVPADTPLSGYTAIEKVGNPGAVNSGASTSGASLIFFKGVGATAVASGTFAVTGCDPEPGAVEFPCP
jgi:hypothetical protein